VTIPLPGGGEYVMRGYGYYFDDYVRTPEGWRLRASRMQRIRVDLEGDDFVMPEGEAGEEP
jgi:hypothetical protein